MGIVAHRVKKDIEFSKIGPCVIFVFTYVLHSFIPSPRDLTPDVLYLCPLLSKFSIHEVSNSSLAETVFPLTPAPDSFCLQPPFPGFCCWLYEWGSLCPTVPQLVGCHCCFVSCTTQPAILVYDVLSLKSCLSLFQLLPNSEISFPLSMPLSVSCITIGDFSSS